MKFLLPVVLLCLLSTGGCSYFADGNQVLLDQIVVEDLPEFQREMVEDGVVTYGEYEKAKQAEYECVKNLRDYIVLSEMTVSRGQLGYTTRITYPEGGAADEPDRIEEETQACRDKYSSAVATYWAAQDVPSDKEREGMRAEVMACFAAAGMSVDEKTTDEEFRSISESFMLSLQPANADEGPDEVSMQKLESYQACTTQHYRFFSFIPE